MTTFPLAAIPEPARFLHSAAAGQDFQISVWPALHYVDCREQVWPMIHVLDANLYCGMAVDMVCAINIWAEFLRLAKPLACDFGQSRQLSEAACRCFGLSAGRWCHDGTVRDIRSETCWSQAPQYLCATRRAGCRPGGLINTQVERPDVRPWRRTLLLMLIVSLHCAQSHGSMTESPRGWCIRSR